MCFCVSGFRCGTEGPPVEADLGQDQPPESSPASSWALPGAPRGLIRASTPQIPQAGGAWAHLGPLTPPRWHQSCSHSLVSCSVFCAPFPPPPPHCWPEEITNQCLHTGDHVCTLSQVLMHRSQRTRTRPCSKLLKLLIKKTTQSHVGHEEAGGPLEAVLGAAGWCVAAPWRGSSSSWILDRGCGGWSLAPPVSIHPRSTGPQERRCGREEAAIQASWCLRLQLSWSLPPSPLSPGREAHQAWAVCSPAPWSQADIWPGPWAASPCGRSPREARPQQGPQGTPPRSGAQARLNQAGSSN